MAPVTPASASGVIQFGKIVYNPAGTDTLTNASINGEYAVIRNLGARSVSLTGWTVRDAQNHIYRFGTYALPGYKSLVLHTGKGTNSSLVRYWGLGNHVWNNTGDHAYLRSPSGAVMDSCTWGSTGSYKIC